MADSSPLAGLLDRAGNVFSLAGKLGRAFHEEHQGQRQQIDPAGWNRHAPDFDEFYAALLDLRDAMQNPPDGFAPVAKPLLEAARIAKGIRDAMQRPDGRTWAAYLEFFPHLNSVCEDGWRALKELTESRRPDDPFAFVDKPAFPLLDRFPATPAGHLAFLEFVRDEVHHAAEAKRQQPQCGYPNATIESLVRYIKWAEAGKRVSALSDLPTEIVEQVARVLRRGLTPGTVEHIDELLTPAVCNLRDAWEYSKGASSPAGDILEAILSVQRELERWNSDNSPSETGYLVEDVPAGHPLHSAVVTLQRHYGGALPKPALRRWRKFLKLVRNDDEDAEDEAERLLEWVNSEFESHRAGDQPDGNHVEIRTAGDLWKALDEGKTPAVVVSAISLGPPFGPNIAPPKFPKPSDQSKWDVLDRALALCDAEGGDRAEAMRKLIAQIALGRGVDRRKIINMPLAEFLEAAAGGSNSTAPSVTDTNGETCQAELAEATSKTTTPPKTKGSTERGGARAKLIAALTKHHKYADGGCLNLEPVGNNELARLAGVSESTASAFFNKQFGGYTKYRTIYGDTTRLVAVLKLLNQEFSPHHLLGTNPPNENDRDNED